MKKWNSPEVAELNVAETANGCRDFYFESCYTEKKEPVKPECGGEEEKDPVVDNFS